ncbi:abnormal spindle-like microcephaly-associated protein isoform X2 [Synchiropus splendidus]|uniref:abnormal spindle-like microcephaly-associated protein isoform X2 n=1 Tax=Synchiropus splendidus TaxID=270530 RepID=UPI00237E58AD|nr:abnormal spindle-like microcephaly-associated protein isoform X2 [Synchiropus splendidus]
MTATGEGLMNFTMHRFEDTDKENDVPVLSLIQFSRPPFLNFGVVKVGTCRSAELLVENPNDEGEAEVWVEKIPSVRGFSVDRDSFTVQPKSSTTLTVTWTPTEDGGVREVVVFNVNGVLKHQAILLGRAEAPKKKKRSLWDKMKTQQKAGGNSGSPRRRWEQPLLKMAGNRNNQLSRNPRSKRDKVRSPLASLNESKATQKGAAVRRCELQQPESFKVVKSSSQVRLLPPSTKSQPENKNPTRLLNKTMSPVGTPDHMKKLMPRIETQSPLPTALDFAGLPSISGALALINSDLSLRRPYYPEFSDSLESPMSHKALPETQNLPRLTFFVSKATLSCQKDPEPPKKLKFSTDTVVKAKAPVPDGQCGRVMKKSRRRILPNQPEHCPVQDIRSQLEVHMSMGPSLDASITITSPSSAPVVPFTPSSHSSPLQPCSPSSINLECPPSDAKLEPSTPSPQKPPSIHLHVMSKKRKSEEGMKSMQTSDGMGELGGLKRSKVTRSKSIREVPLKKSARKSRPSGSASIRSSRSSSLKTSRVPAVAKTTLVFCRTAETAVPRHPLPFAAKNMFYDERWMEKQERGFTWWLNYVLTPEDFRVTTEVTTVSATCLSVGANEKVSVVRAPTKEEVSFSMYTAHRRLNRLRRAACHLFTSDAMVKAIQKLELEVEARRLVVRRDRPLWRDIGKRQQVLTWILSYNPLWLRIGLETIFGELVPLTCNSDTVGLATFVLQRFLWNPDIAAQFRHPTVPHLYREGHEEALSRFTLKKLLLLVCFLDRAKQSRLMEHDPCLFCKDAQFKSSKDLLLAFSRDFLSGEGILPRHLGYLGLPVCHVQTPLDEFDFAVTNLAVDLRCGVRLARVMELLLHQWTLSSKLRLPVVSRLQKVHNVDVTLQLLQSHGVQLKDEHGSVITAKDVVDGHREKTLSLLWMIILTFQVETVLDEKQLKEEICFLQRSFRTCKSDHTSLSWDSYQHPSTKIGLLMDWVRCVCAFYNIKVENFSVAFSDGRVLCLLIHHYHPCLIPRASVGLRTTQTVDRPSRGCVALDCSSDTDSFSDNLTDTDPQNTEFTELLENEKKNFRLVNSAVKFLGGIPAMIQLSDMSNTIPNEKVVMSYVTFLCVRLLDLRNETRAALRIQAFWRSHCLKKDQLLHKRRSTAAVKIQTLVRNFLRRRRDQNRARAALVIQTMWRGFEVRRRLRREQEAALQLKQDIAATLIQTQWRRFMALRSYKLIRTSVLLIQTAWRTHRAVLHFQRLKGAAQVIQEHFRARILARAERSTFLAMRNAALKIQRSFRGWRRSRMERENQAATVIQTSFRRWYWVRVQSKTVAAIKIQAAYRGKKTRDSLERQKRAATLIQAVYRGKRTRKSLIRRHRAATLIQAVYRGKRTRGSLERRRRAATLIQAVYRGKRTRDSLQRRRRAATLIQAVYRGKRTRDSLERQHRAATLIQAVYRGMRTRDSLQRRRRAATLIQAVYRGKRTRDSLERRQRAATLIQAVYRGKRTRDSLERRHRAATLIQAVYRGKRTRDSLERRHRAATLIQAVYRGKKTRDSLERQKRAATLIQAVYRGKRTRKSLIRRHRAATLIQAVYRGKRTRDSLERRCRAATLIQAVYRGMRTRNSLQRRHRAATLIQAVYRGKRTRGSLERRRRAATLIQAVYRGMRTRNSLERRHRAATLIQAVYRGKRTRDSLERRHRAATLIQAVYRGMRTRDSLQRRRRAATLIQAVYRGKRTRDSLERQHRAATLIQAVYRGMRTRDSLQRRRRAATLIQAVYRGKRTRDSLERRQRAATLIQAVYRGKRTRDSLERRHRAATLIQAVYRGKRTRDCLERQHRAATLIQAVYRGTRTRKSLIRRHRASTLIQAVYRGTRTRKSLIRQHRAATLIQAVYRGKRTRDSLERRHRAATLIQAVYRGKRTRDSLQRRCRAATLIQAFYRGKRTRDCLERQHRAATLIQAVYRGKRTRDSLQRRCRAATLIQAVYRGKRTRDCLERRRRAATLIQAVYRGKRTRDSLQRRRRAATLIQAVYRGKRTRDSLQRRCRAATLIQAFYRGKRTRDCLERQHRASTLIQAVYRGTRTRKSLIRQHRAATLIQAVYRGKRTRDSLERRHRAATLIQAVYRGKRTRDSLERRHRAATLIQAVYRGKRTRDSLERRHRAATLIQAVYRGMRTRESMSRQHQAATLIQAVYRGKRTRASLERRHRAATLIQAVYRGKRTRASLERRHRAATLIQAVYRGKRTREALERRHRAATLIQAVYRGMRTRESMSRQHQAATLIQAVYRGKRTRASLERRHRAATLIQAVYRGKGTREFLAKQQKAATIIQAVYRGKRTRESLTRRHRAATLIQAVYRGKRVRNSLKEQCFLAQQNRAAIVLQAAFKGWWVRRHIARLNRAATLIQTAFRRFTAEVKYRAIRLSALTLQTHYRRWQLLQQDRQHFLDVKRAAIILQAAFRGHAVRWEIRHRHCAATVIQSHWRGHECRRQFLKTRDAAVTLQRQFRAAQVYQQQRDEVQRQLRFTAAVFHHLKAIKIQRALRRHWALEFAKAQVPYVVVIQSWVRAWQQRRRFLQDRHHVILVQRAVRRWLACRDRAANVIQQAARRFLLRIRQQRVRLGIIQAQALWRGHCSRKVHDNRRIIALRHKLRQISADVQDQDKLGQKTSSALDLLLHYKHVSGILEALKNLETATRLSPVCCERLVEGGATSVVFKLIRCCNRSVACMDVIVACVQILLHLSKYHRTVEAVVSVDNWLETLLDLLQKYRGKSGDKVSDKRGSIFTHVCLLLIVLLQDPQRAQVVMSQVKLMERVQSIYRLMARKHHMESRRNVANKMSTNSSLLLPATARPRPPLRLTPDWVLGRRGVLDEVDPLRAMQMLAGLLFVPL